MKKRIIATLLAVCILFVSGPIPTTAASGDNIGRYAVPNPNVTSFFVYNEDTGDTDSFYPSDFSEDTVFYIEDFKTNDNGEWYKVSFHTGTVVGDYAQFWPAKPWVIADGLKFIDLCTCCEHCTGAEGCECGCESCDFCEKEEEIPCPICGTPGCTSDHPNWCEICKKDDCGIDHTVTEPSEPENTCACCDSCTGAEGCTCECGDCDFCEKPEVPTQLENIEKGVTVTAGEMIPAGSTLQVSDADVSAMLNKFGVADKYVFGLDIKVLTADSAQWQPEDSVMVQIPVSAPVGTKIGLLHTHEGKTTFIGTTVVDANGYIEFYAEGFSEFAGFTVDFHYNDVDFSIEGMTSILLSELFAALGIDEDTTNAKHVIFSDPELVSVDEEGDDWRLTSLKAFQTEEALIITFEDEHTIIIDVTDAASLTNAKELSGDTILFFADVADQYGIYATITDTWGLKAGSWSLQIDGVQKSTSKATMTYGSNHFGIRSDYYWFEVSGASGNTSYKSGDVASFKFDGLPGSVSITYNAHSNIVYKNTSYCQVRQQSQAVYAGHTDTRCVKIYADGNFVQEIWPVMPSRDKGRGYSTSDIYVDALYGPYYTSSVSVENNTYIVRLYSRYTVSGSVADSKGTASPASQTVNYGNSGSIAFAASSGYVIDYIMDGSTKVEVSDADNYTYTVSNVTSSRSVVAYTKIKTFTVSYSSNGGSGATAAQTFNYGSSVALRANGFTAPSGYQFLGWYSSADKAVYTAGATYARNESTTMTALWGKQSTASAWNHEFYVLPGTTTFTDQMRIIDGATRNTEQAIGRPPVMADNNTYYVAPGTTLTFERSGGRWRVDNDSHTGITASVGTSWSTTNTITVTVSGSAAAGSDMMIYSRSETGTTVNCARIIVATKEDVTTMAINDTQNIYRVGVYILCDSTKIPGEPNYTSGVSMININGGMNYAASAKGIVYDNIATTAHYIPSLDGSCTMGVVDYTGRETIPYMNAVLLDAAMDQVIHALADGTVLTAADGADLKTLYVEKGADYIRQNFAVRPHIAKLMTGLSYNELGWHVDCSIYPLQTISLTYNLNLPTGYILKTVGTPAPGIFTGDLDVEEAVFTVPAEPQLNSVYSATVTGATDTVSLTFKGWNTKADGTGETYVPGSPITIESDTILYAKWSGGEFNTGTLEIYKEVSTVENSDEPSNGDTFTFEINLGGSYAYTVYAASTGAKLRSGTMTNGTFTLQDGQFIRFTGVPKAKYTITETSLPVHYSIETATQEINLVGGYVNKVTFSNEYSNIPSFTITGTIDNGTVNGTVQKESQSVLRGSSSAEMVFMPNEGYEISSITVDDSSITVTEALKKGYTYPVQNNVTAAHTVVVTTIKKTYTVNVVADSGVDVGETYPRTVEHGENITITFAPKSGYEIQRVDVDGQSYGTTIEQGILKLEIKKDTTVTITSVCTRGDLTIQKTGDNIDPNQVFIFEVTCGDDFKLQVPVKGKGSVTIYQLKAGTYTVTEITTWSWRYTPNQQSQTVTISGGDITTVTFNNSRTNNDWLSAFYNIINAKGS